MARSISEKELFYDRMGDAFAASLSDYDTSRRVETLTHQFLGGRGVEGKSVLDVGCGLGFFSEAILRMGGIVTATDLAPSLVERVRNRLHCRAEVADALDLAKQYGPESFDFVISSECIEHTPDPDEAIRQMCLVLKPGGFLSLSTPNVVWYPVVAIASKLKLRAFDGIENFNTFGRMRRAIEREGARVLEEYGLHLFPFQFGIHGLSRACDKHLQFTRPLMINLCVLAEKPARGQCNSALTK